MKSEKLLDAFNYVEDQYLELVEIPSQKRISLKKKAVVLIAAVVCISILSVTAIAKLPSVFQYLMQLDPQDAPLYEAAEEANKDWEPEPVELPQLKEADLVISQKYYNGKTVLLGLDVKAVEGDPVIGFEPDELLLKQIQAFGETPPAEATPEAYDEIPYPRYARSMAASLRRNLTPDQYKKVQKCMEKTGHCCVVSQNVFVGDHILVNGTDMMATYDVEQNAYAGITEGSTPAGEAIRLEPLPENAQNQQEVTVQLNIKSSLTYWYLDTDGHAYRYYGHTDAAPARITIINSEKQ